MENNVFYKAWKMETLRVNATIPSDGHLKIDVPTRLNGDVEVILVIEQKTKSINKYDFSDLSGKLKFNEDPLMAQKEMRSEWK